MKTLKELKSKVILMDDLEVQKIEDRILNALVFEEEYVIIDVINKQWERIKDRFIKSNYKIETFEPDNGLERSKNQPYFITTKVYLS